MNDKIATAGSCFAQHIARTLRGKGYSYLETESGPADRHYGLFSARFGNIYTTRQLLQLFQRAYGLFRPLDEAWNFKEGRLVDPFRPTVEPDGFATIEELRADRADHLAAVRQMFENCDVFVFTLGLTEGWVSTRDGAVFPLAPGVSGSPPQPDGYAFHNFSVSESLEDLEAFIAGLRTVNPDVRLIFTVSPVPLIATYQKSHVLTATIYSKSVLRVVAEEIVNKTEAAAYYPSYEIITGHHAGYDFFEEDLRSVTNAGVDRAMTLFSQHYLDGGQKSEQKKPEAVTEDGKEETTAKDSGYKAAASEDLYQIVCDEEKIEE